MRAARKTAMGEIRNHDCQHLEPYLEGHFDTIIADQNAFLGTHVPTGWLPGRPRPPHRTSPTLPESPDHRRRQHNTHRLSNSQWAT